MIGIITQIKKSNYAKQLALGFIIAAITALASLALMGTAGWFLASCALAGAVSINYSFNYLIPAAFVRLFALTRVLGNYTERLITHNATFGYLSELRVWVYQSLQKLTPAQLFDFHRGDLLSRLISDIDLLNQFYLRTAIPIVNIILASMVTLSVIFYLSIQTGLVILVIYSISFIFIPILFFRKIKKLILLENKTNNHLISHSVNYITELKNHINSNKKNTIQPIQNKLYTTQKNLNHIQAIMSALMVLLVGLGCLFILYFIQTLPLQALALLLLLSMGEWMTRSIIISSAFVTTQESIKRVNSLVDITSDTVFPNTDSIPTEFDLVIKNLNFNFNNKQNILTDLNLAIPHKSTVLISGPSGCGKTSLINLITRSLEPQSGEIYLGKENIKVFSEINLRKTICLTPQFAHVFNLSIKENLLLGLENNKIEDTKLWWALEQVCLKERFLKEKNGLDTLLGITGLQLSTGEKRRLAIARALLRNAPINIFDEPTEGLDHKTADMVINNLFQIYKNKTLIIISHQLSQDNPNFNQVVALENKSFGK